MSTPYEQYKDLEGYFAKVETEFLVRLQGGAYLRFANSGRRGETKWFDFGLSEILTILEDIKVNIHAFAEISGYEEGAWRDLGSRYFRDEVARSMVTVQTKPLFTFVSKVIHWANDTDPANYSDQTMMLSPIQIDVAVQKVSKLVAGLAPDAAAVMLSVRATEIVAAHKLSSTEDWRDVFLVDLVKSGFIMQT